MKKNKRIDSLLDSLKINSGEKAKKTKEKSLPPRSQKEAQLIFDRLWEISPVLSLCSQIQAVTGLRYSDASWLKFNDFMDNNGDFKDSALVIQQKVFNMIMHSNKMNAQVAAKRSTVKVLIDESVKDIVKKCKEINKGDEYLFANARSSYIDEEGFKQSRPMSVNSAAEHHLKVQKQLNLNFQLGTESWRAFFAANLVKNKLTIFEVRDLLGHLSVNSTDNYLHSFGGRLNELVQK